MPDRRYYELHRERLLAETRAWKAANPERSREHNRNSARRAAVQRRLNAKRRAHGRAWYAEHRSEERERARQFRRDHPEKVAEYRARFAGRHPGRVTDQNRRASERWRDRNADEVRQKQRIAAQRRRAHDPDEFRRWYQSNLERQRQRGRDASRRRSRLKELGLPPRQINRTFAEDRRANDRAAADFFARRRSAAEIIQLHREGRIQFRRATPVLVEALRARQRIMSRGELFAAGRALQECLRAAKARDLAKTFLPEVAHRVTRIRGDKIREEIEQDSIARQYRRLQPYVLETELRRRVRTEASELALALAQRSVDAEKMRLLVEERLPISTGRRRAGAEGGRARAAAAGLNDSSGSIGMAIRATQSRGSSAPRREF